VGYGVALWRLPFAVEEGASQAIVAVVANGGAGVPEFLGVGLVGYIFQRACDLSIFDLIEQLAAELEVVALLVDGVGAGSYDIDAFFYVFYQFVWCKRRLAGRREILGMRWN
jgi:hypothetical protein